ncbi:leucine zipper domain-containing protein [Streptomyces sp. Y2F8-2]|uniref:leucine zipper domain-containing protein n=1 Tax=Streptomyces sp. Y2F8-2 TaxID=2759675 RepID=UPI0035B524A7
MCSSLRIDAGRPIALVAVETGISRRCPAKWYARWRVHGENGLLDHSSRSATSPARTPRTSPTWPWHCGGRSSKAPRDSPPTFNGCMASPSRGLPSTASW